MIHSQRTLVFFFLFVLYLVPARSQAANSVVGVVRDPQGGAIPGARVTLTRRDSTSPFAVTTDRSGEYRFSDLAAGMYLLQATAAGFANSPPRSIEIAGEGRLTEDISLPIAGLQTSVVVTATGTPQTTDELSKDVSVLDGRTLDQRDDSSVAEALRTLPGMRIQRLGGPAAATTIFSRGLPSYNTAVLVDGFRLRDISTTQGDAAPLIQDLLVTDVDRVEVLRGAGSSLYGTNAVGGVVNIVTGEGGGRRHSSILAEGGSLGTFRGRAQTTGGLFADRLQYSLGVSHLNVVNGVDGDDPARITGLQGRLGYALSSKVRLSGRLFAADSFAKLNDSPGSVGILPPTGIVDAIPLATSELRRYQNGTPLSELQLGNATYIPATDNPDDTRANRFLSGVLSLSAHPIESVGITVDYQGLRTRRRFGDGPAGVGFPPAGSTLSFYDGTAHTVSARVDWRIGRHQSVDAGYEFENEHYANHTLAPDPVENAWVDATQRSSTFFIQDQVRLFDDRLQLAASYRAQGFTLTQPVLTPASNAPYSGGHFDAPPAAQTGDGSVAYFFRQSGTKIRAHAGRGYRAPSLYERFGTYYSTFGYSAFGDPRLRPERSISVDGGIDQIFWSNRATFSATYFYTRMQEVIVYDTTGAIIPAVDPYGRYGGYRNTNGGLARGVEANASVAATKSTTIRGAYTFTNSLLRTPLVPGVIRAYSVPDHMASVVVVQRVSPRLTLMFDLVASSNYLSPIYDSVTFTSRAYRFNGMKQAKLGGSYRWPMGEFRALRFFANVSNLTNQRYDEGGFLTPGATAMSGLQFEF
jgi:outer membrane cobalamin receptor